MTKKHRPGSSSDATLLTDIGNAARFVNQCGDDFRFCGAWGKWTHWDGTRWRLDVTGHTIKAAKKVALSIHTEAQTEPDLERQRKIGQFAIASQRRERLTAMVELAKCELSITPDDLDANPFLLNVLNGTVDLKTGKLQPHDRRDFLTKIAPVKFDPAATCPIFTAFLDKIMDRNARMIGYLQRIAGVCLTADVREQELHLFYGVGANGKSVFLDTLTGMCGDYAGEAAPDLLIERRNPEHSTEIADLCGRRLVVSCELPEGGKLRTNLLKRLTGNARLKARCMRQDFFEFTRTHKLIVATNNKPVVPESTHAIWRRLRLIPFAVVIPPEEQDKALLAKLKKEWPGILNWAIQGCLAWQKDGMQTPPEVLLATQAYESEQDPLADFLAERCILAVNAFTSRTELFKAYKVYAEQQHEYPLDRNGFYERIRAKKGIQGDQRRFSGSPMRGFSGIGLLSPLLEANHA